MSIENSIIVPLILLIVAFCICFMLRFHHIAVKQANIVNDNIKNPVRVIRIADVIIDVLEKEGD